MKIFEIVVAVIIAILLIFAIKNEENKLSLSDDRYCKGGYIFLKSYNGFGGTGWIQILNDKGHGIKCK